jgi:hypothetical protein
MFGRKKKREQDVAEQTEAAEHQTPDSSESDGSEAAAASGRRAAGGVDGKTDRSNGPWDASEVEDDDSLIDLGSLRIKPVEGMNLNLEVEQESQAIVSVALELHESRVQLQAFAAPKSESLWPGISAQIDESVTSQGGRTDRRDGRFGEELLARVPATGPDGSQGIMIARFVGVDGPRWFLRAVSRNCWPPWSLIGATPRCLPPNCCPCTFRTRPWQAWRRTIRTTRAGSTRADRSAAPR